MAQPKTVLELMKEASDQVDMFREKGYSIKDAFLITACMQSMIQATISQKMVERANGRL